MRTFNYSAIKEQKWDSDILGLIAAIYKEAGKQELYLKQRPEELEKLVEIAKIQSTEASNAIEGIVTTSTRIRQLDVYKRQRKGCDSTAGAGRGTWCRPSPCTGRADICGRNAAVGD